MWNIAGSLLANLAPASKTQIYILNALDSVYLTAGCLMIARAFGWRVLAVALLVFATNFPSRFYWTGVRFALGLVVLDDRERVPAQEAAPGLGGTGTGVFDPLRIFPIFLFVAPVLAAGYHLIGIAAPQNLPALLCRAALGAALLIPAGMAVVGRADTYQNSCATR